MYTNSEVVFLISRSISVGPVAFTLDQNCEISVHSYASNVWLILSHGVNQSHPDTWLATCSPAVTEAHNGPVTVPRHEASFSSTSSHVSKVDVVRNLLLTMWSELANSLLTRSPRSSAPPLPRPATARSPSPATMPSCLRLAPVVCSSKSCSSAWASFRRRGTSWRTWRRRLQLERPSSGMGIL